MGRQRKHRIRVPRLPEEVMEKERRPAASRILLCSINYYFDIYYLELPQNLPCVYPPLGTVWKKLKKLKPQPMGLIGTDDSYYSSSAGLLCVMKHSMVYLFDVFRSSVPKYTLCIPAEAFAHNTLVRILHFKSYPLSHTYTVILGICDIEHQHYQHSYLMYHSSSGKWRRSKNVVADMYEVESFTGDSVCFLGKDKSSIYRYGIDADCWSIKPVSFQQNPDWNTVRDVNLFYGKSELMLVGSLSSELLVWHGVEEKGSYIFTKVSSHTVPHSNRHANFTYWIDYDFLRIARFDVSNIYFGPEDVSTNIYFGPEVREVTVYRPSTNTWHFIDRPPNFINHGHLLHFLSETKWMFLRPSGQ